MGESRPAMSASMQPEHAAAWQAIVGAVHRETPAKIALQLNHAGRRGATRPRAAGVDKPLRDGNWPLLAPSALPYRRMNQTPKAMDDADMEAVRAAFVAAAQAGTEAGFDLLALNMAHGYLLGSFLSPLTNRRDDTYGGPLAHRLRFPLTILDAVRAVWPAEKPLAVALNATDWAKGGLDVPEAVAIARALAEHGCDLIAVQAGQTTPAAHPVYDPEALAGYTDTIRNDAKVPTLATVYTTTTGQASTLLAGGRTDLSLFTVPEPPR